MDRNEITLQTSNSSGLPLVLPLPYRVIFLVGSGILCWATNLQGLYSKGIDVCYVLENSQLPRRPIQYSTEPTRPPYSAVYRLFTCFMLWAGANWCTFRFVTAARDFSTIDHYRISIVVCIAGILGGLLTPSDVFCRRERILFLRSLKRCFVWTSKPNFSEVILADILTSYAKVLGDIWISGSMLLPGGSLLLRGNEGTLAEWAVPLMISFPYLLRFYQCLVEFVAMERRTHAPIYNALKYLTAFPVIILSAMQKTVVEQSAITNGQNKDTVWYGEHPLFRLWFLAVILNSCYSFWWDTSNDWGFTLLRWQVNSAEENKPLRAVKPGLRNGLLLFPNRVYPYYFATLLNFVLRFTWSLKLSPHLHTVADLESWVFLSEALEVFRRWIWVFIRVEWESVKQQQDSVIFLEQSHQSNIERKL